ncbi:WbqC family protein, partial [Candidatus Parcubacteria bacterium]|nr:WbqC family protein [Candidatus Parcubacteria bacterium]
MKIYFHFSLICNYKMILVGHQPEYLPYLGFFYKVAKADKFVFVDHVQFQKEGFQNRNRIRTGLGLDGWTWLT